MTSAGETSICQSIDLSPVSSFKPLMYRLETAAETFWSLTRALKSEIIVALGVLVVVYFVTSALRRRRRNSPPGPVGWPIVGYIPFLSQNAHFDFFELGKKYGNVFSLKLGSKTMVVLHGVEAMKEALSKPEFLGRPPNGPVKFFNEGSAFFMGDLHKWKEHRRFMLHSLRDLGLGKTAVEGETMDEIRHFIEVLRKHSGVPMDMKEPLTPSMSNSICTLVFGKRYEYEDPDRVFLDSNLETGFESFNDTSIVVYFPWMARIPFVGKLANMDKSLKAFTNLKNFFRQEIRKHMETIDSKHIRDFVDSFIVEMESRKQKDKETTFSDESLISDVLDIFSGSSETVRNCILWYVYVAAAFPDAQKRVLEEILEVMGPDRDPEFQDMKRMPFTHSFMLEVMRWQTIVPMNVPHYTLADTTVAGYDIPKHTTVLMNLWHAHHDPNYWTDPESFIPDRFVTKDGKSVSTPSHLMTFSMGKRKCPGESMAIMQMFLYFTSILQKFQVDFPEGYKPTYKAALHATYRLDPYKIVYMARN